MLRTISDWAVPVLLGFIPLYGMLRRVPVFEAFIEGAEEGLRLSLTLAPYLAGILIALAIFRQSGAMYHLSNWLAPLLGPLGIPPEILPLAIIRPLSGSGSLAATVELMRAHGPDSLLGKLACTIQGSTDTTFYVLTVYFGSAGIRRSRWAVPVGLLGDATSLLVSLLVWRWWT